MGSKKEPGKGQEYFAFILEHKEVMYMTLQDITMQKIMHMYEAHAYLQWNLHWHIYE